MPYQNNNNRIVPNEVIDTKLNPVASPTNQEIKYQVDLSKAKGTAGTADALAKLGQGILDIDITLNRKAQEDIIAAEYATQAKGQNKRDWADVSKNIKGMAKFNPYMKDAFRTYVAQDIYRGATIELQSNPNVLSGKMSVEQYDKFKHDTIEKMMTSFNESGLNPQNYTEYVNQFHNDVFKVDDHYITKNAEYTYNNTLTAMAHDAAFKMGANLSAATDEATKLDSLQETINNSIKVMEELGVPADEMINKVLNVGLTEFLVNNADKIDSGTVMAMLSNTTIGGKHLNEIVPNFDYQVQELMTKIKRSNYEDRRLEYENEQLTQKIDIDNANKEYFSWFKNNQNASPEEIQAQAMGLISKYDLDAKGAEFLHDIANTRGLMTKLKENITDPDTYNSLMAKACTGDLTGSEIAEAIHNGTLSPDDALKLQNKLEAIDKQGATEFKQKAKRVLDSYTTKTGAYYSTTPKDIQNNINTAITQIQAKLDSGEYTSAQANQKLEQLRKAIPNMQLEQDVKNKNYNIILNGTYRSTQNIPTPNITKAQQAIVNLGILRNKQGLRDKSITIASPQSNNRRGSKHMGNDLNGAYLGRPVYPPSGGRIIAAGSESTMGNYAVFRDNRGKFMLFMHLQTPVKTGVIQRQQVLGYVGNTGRVDNKNTGCLHVEFWDRDLRIVKPEEW